jgi:hypothetical protein
MRLVYHSVFYTYKVSIIHTIVISAGLRAFLDNIEDKA